MEKSRNITDAEWQVMRIIWAEGCVTSRYLIETLQKSREWSPTTVKTLLARLVKKEIIGYTVRGRAREYTANILELDCVRNEMNNVIMRLYGGEENKRTAVMIQSKANMMESDTDTMGPWLIVSQSQSRSPSSPPSILVFLLLLVLLLSRPSPLSFVSFLRVPSWFKHLTAYFLTSYLPPDSFTIPFLTYQS